MTLRLRPASAGLFLLAFALGCGRPDAPPAKPRPTPAQVSAATFATLDWVVGRWRGSGADGVPFYESYVRVDSVTIVSMTHADSTFAPASDSGRLVLRGDTLFDGSPTMQWVATAIDPTGVTFAAWHGASNDFSWSRTGPGAWRATLYYDSAGTRASRVYEMRAVPSVPAADAPHR